MIRSITFVTASALLLALPGCGKDSAGPENAKPDAQFSATCAALRCDFTESSTDSDGEVTAWSWDFGDGSAVSTERQPYHVYGAPGQYTVKLTVTDNEEEAASDSTKVITREPTVSKFSCADPGAAGGYVACSLMLEEPSGFKVVIVSSSCRAHGNVFRITQPVQDTLTTDGCYEPVNKELRFNGPFPAGTEIAAEVLAPKLDNAPSLRVTGSYPEWTLTFEDGGDADFDDLVMKLTALPAN